MVAFSALADPTRREIVEMLAKGERPVGEIARRFDVSAPAISQHLKVLRKARLVGIRPEGQRRIYRLDPAGFAELDSWLGAIWRRGGAPPHLRSSDHIPAYRPSHDLLRAL